MARSFFYAWMVFLGLLNALPATVWGQQDNWLISDRLVYGQSVTPEFLKGKVYLVEYWGIHCGPCLAAMPKLRDLQAQYGPSGAFCIIGSHVQPPEEGVKEFLNKSEINFPVYQNVVHPEARPQGGIPYSALFDAKGTLVIQGHPGEVVAKIPELVEQALQLRRLMSGPLPHPFAGLNISKQGMELFTPGKSWSGPYKKLKKAADKGAADMEKALSTLDSYITEQCGELTKQADDSPAAAYESIMLLRKSLKGMEQEEQLASIADPMTKDKNVKDLAQILSNLLKLEAAADSGNVKPAVIKKKAESFVRNLTNYIARPNLDPKLQKEAQEAQKKAQKLASNEQSDVMNGSREPE